MVLNHTYLFFKMQTIHWPSRQEKNVQIVDTTCPWVSKVGVAVTIPLVFFPYILDEPIEYTAAYDSNKRFLIFLARFAVLLSLIQYFCLARPNPPRHFFLFALVAFKPGLDECGKEQGSGHGVIG